MLHVAGVVVIGVVVVVVRDLSLSLGHPRGQLTDVRPGLSHFYHGALLILFPFDLVQSRSQLSLLLAPRPDGSSQCCLLVCCDVWLGLQRLCELWRHIEHHTCDRHVTGRWRGTSAHTHPFAPFWCFSMACSRRQCSRASVDDLNWEVRTLPHFFHPSGPQNNSNTRSHQANGVLCGRGMILATSQRTTSPAAPDLNVEFSPPMSKLNSALTILSNFSSLMPFAAVPRVSTDTSQRPPSL
mmetsp:Transcript_40696/g.116027  ORF Transcript_40696/g.116027 Transcript_40696/m.116027 type:complete len:240 (+) Transcript_40696:1443-2162(+)